MLQPGPLLFHGFTFALAGIMIYVALDAAYNPAHEGKRMAVVESKVRSFNTKVDRDSGGSSNGDEEPMILHVSGRCCSVACLTAAVPGSARVSHHVGAARHNCAG